MPEERAEAVLFQGKALTLVGRELQRGERAPDFTVVDKDLKTIGLADTAGPVRVFSVVPSLDTPVCDIQTRRFNQEAGSLDDVRIYTVSMDLPFAQSRWCEEAGADDIVMLSDHRDAKFGRNYGTLIKELRLHSRAIFVVDREGVLRHVEYVKAIHHHPDYEAALKSVRKAAG